MKLLPYLLILTLLFAVTISFSQAIIEGQTANISATTTGTGNDWQDVGSVTFTAPSGAKKVLVVATMEINITSGTVDLQTQFRLSDGTSVSPVIQRYVSQKDYDDYGLASVSHIFEYETAQSGSKTFTLQHSKAATGKSKQFTTTASLVAMVVDDSQVTLPVKMSTIASNVTTTNTAYEQVAGSGSDSIVLVKPGSVYLNACFSVLADAGTPTGSWVFRSSTDGTTFTEIPGAEKSRSLTTNPGAVMITKMVDLDAGTYYFDLAHKTSSNTLTTRNLCLCAVGLIDTTGFVFAPFTSSGGSDDNSTASFEDVSSVTGKSLNNTNSLFIHATFNMTSAAIVNNAAWKLNITTGTFTPQTLQRYVAAGTTGSGGICGLTTGLTASSSGTVALQHQSVDGVTLTTNNVNLNGFQLASSPAFEMNGGDNWNSASSWSTGVVPTISDSVRIPSGRNAVIADSDTAECSILVVDASGSLTVQSESEATNGSLIVADSVYGDVVVERYITYNKWHIVAPPVRGQDIQTLITGNDIAENSGTYGAASYDESTNSWNSFYTSATSGDFNNGEGYILRRGTSDGDVVFTGNLAASDVTLPVTYTAPYGWNSIGNPYSSAIGVTDGASSDENFLTYNAAILNDDYEAIYIWDPGTGDYVIMNNAGFTNNTGKTAWGDDHLQVGQGFIVRANTAGNVTFTQKMRLHKTDQLFKSAEISWPSVIVQIKRGGQKATTSVTFHEEMTTGLDISYDAGAFKQDFAIYSQLVDDNGTDFALQCLPTSQMESLEIPLGIDANEGDTLVFSMQSIALPEGIIPILKDNKEDKSIKYNTANTTYTSLVGTQTTGYGRFSLLFSDNTAAEDLSKSDIYVTPERGAINVTGKMQSGARAALYDIHGRKLKDFQLTDPWHNCLPTGSIQSGVYLLKINSGAIVRTFKVPYTW